MAQNIFFIGLNVLLWNLILCSGQTPTIPCGTNECFLDLSKVDPQLSFTPSNNDVCHSEWSQLTAFRCPENYQLQPSQLSSFCDPSRLYTWYPDVYSIRCRAPCHVPPELPANVSIKYSSNSAGTDIYLDSEIITYSCENGTLFPFSKTSCSDGNWTNAEIPQCLAGCNFPPNTRSKQTSDSSVGHGYVVTLECQDGFQTSLNTTSPVNAKCNNGNFDKLIVCTQIYETTESLRISTELELTPLNTRTGNVISSTFSSLLPVSTTSITDSSSATQDSNVTSTEVNVQAGSTITAFTNKLTALRTLVTDVITNADKTSTGSGVSTKRSRWLNSTRTTNDNGSIASTTNSVPSSTSPTTVITQNDNVNQSTVSLTASMTSNTSFVTTEKDANVERTTLLSQLTKLFYTSGTTKKNMSDTTTDAASAGLSTISSSDVQTTTTDYTDQHIASSVVPSVSSTDIPKNNRTSRRLTTQSILLNTATASRGISSTETTTPSKPSTVSPTVFTAIDGMATNRSAVPPTSLSAFSTVLATVNDTFIRTLSTTVTSHLSTIPNYGENSENPITTLPKVSPFLSATATSTLSKEDGSSVTPTVSLSQDADRTTHSHGTDQYNMSSSIPSFLSTAGISKHNGTSISATDSWKQFSTLLNTAATKVTSYTEATAYSTTSASSNKMKTSKGETTYGSTSPSISLSPLSTTIPTTVDDTFKRTTSPSSTLLGTGESTKGLTSTLSKVSFFSSTITQTTTKELTTNALFLTSTSLPTTPTISFVSTEDFPVTEPTTSSSPPTKFSTTSKEEIISTILSTRSPTSLANTMTTKEDQTSSMVTVFTKPLSKMSSAVTSADEEIVSTMTSQSLSTFPSSTKSVDDSFTPSSFLPTKSTIEKDKPVSSTSSALSSTSTEATTPTLLTVSSTLLPTLSTRAKPTVNGPSTTSLDELTQSPTGVTKTLSSVSVTTKALSTLSPSFCGPPEVEGPLTYEPKSQKYREYEKIIYSCRDSLQLVGNPNAICKGGRFYPSVQPTCKEKDNCNELQCDKQDGYCDENGVCICKPGYSQVGTECIETYPIKTFVSLNATWRETYNSRLSSDFIELEADICIAFQLVLSSKIPSGSFLACFVISFKEGSIQAEVSTKLAKKSNVTAKDVEKIINDKAEMTEGFTLPGMKYNFTRNVKSTEPDFCDEGIHDCDELFGICVPGGKGPYSCRCKEGSVNSKGVSLDGVSCVPDNSLVLVIGVSVTAGLLLALILICLTLFCMKILLHRRDRVMASYKQDMSTSSSNHHDTPNETYYVNDKDLDERMARIAQKIEQMNVITSIPKANVYPLKRPNGTINPEAPQQGRDYDGSKFYNKAYTEGDAW